MPQELKVYPIRIKSCSFFFFNISAVKKKSNKDIGLNKLLSEMGKVN